jgi:hypothetical protein
MTKTLPLRAARRQVLLLVPSVPSPGLARAEKELYRALTAVAGAHALLCVPEDKPLSARLDEAALAAKGAEVYSFSPSPRAEVSGRLKTLITANPGLEVIGFAGLEALRRHLVDARLFAPSKAFFAVLGAGDLAALRSPGPGGTAPGEENRRLLSCCDAVFCSEAAGAQFLRLRFGAAAHSYEDLPAALAALGRGKALKADRLGLLYRAPFPATGAAFRAVRRKSLPRSAQFFAAANSAVLAAPGDIPFWAVVSSGFTCCAALWERLAGACRVFPGAGLILPSRAEFSGPAGSRPPAAALEALSLARQGNHSEPLLVEDLPLAIVRASAFRSVGGFDPRFVSPACAWTDLALRLRQAGYGVVCADDAVLCSAKTPAPAPGDIDLLTHKWCAEGLKVMELLAFELGGRQP